MMSKLAMNTVTDNRKLGFTIVENELIHNYDLTPYEGWLYVVLLSHVNRNTGVAFPGFGRLSRLSGMSRSTVIRTIDSLISRGLISKKTSRPESEYESNEYTFLSLRVVSEGHHPSITQTPPLVSGRHHPSIRQTPPSVTTTPEPDSLTKRINQSDGTIVPQTPESPLQKVIRNRRAKP